jgi:hypothetical protein
MAIINFKPRQSWACICILFCSSHNFDQNNSFVHLPEIPIDFANNLMAGLSAALAFCQDQSMY